MKSLKLLTLSALIAVLASCGGGGSSASNTLLPPSQIQVSAKCSSTSCTAIITWSQSQYQNGMQATYTLLKGSSTVQGPKTIAEQVNNSITLTGLTPETSYVFNVYASLRGSNSPTSSKPFTTPPAGQSQINWPGDGAGSASANLSTGSGSGSFNAASDSSGKTVSYTNVIKFSDGSTDTAASATTPTCTTSTCTYKLAGISKTNETITWTANATDAASVTGKQTTIQTSTPALTTELYTYPSNKTQAATMQTYLQSSDASFVHVAIIKLADFDESKAIAFKNNGLCGSSPTPYWSSCYSTWLTQSSSNKVVGLINAVTNTDLAGVDGTNIVSQLSNNNSWTTSFTGGLTVDAEPFWCGSHSGQANNSGHHMDFYTQLANYTSGSSVNLPLSIYINPKYFTSAFCTTGGIQNVDTLSQILAVNSNNNVLLPSYDGADQYLSAAITNIDTSQLNYKIILPASTDNPIPAQQSSMCAYLKLLNSRNDILNDSHFKGFVLYQLASTVQPDSTRMAAINQFLTNNGNCS